MATHKSSIIRARQTIRRNEINRARRASIQTVVKAVDAAVAGKDEAAGKKALAEAQSALARGAQKGAMHWKTASRKASRLAKRVKALKKSK